MADAFMFAAENNGQQRQAAPDPHNVRLRLFHAIYFRFAVHYANIVPSKVRMLLEYFILVKALLFLAILVYVHNAFVRQPGACVKEIGTWPRDGIVRLEVVPNSDKIRALFSALESEEELIWALKQNYPNMTYSFNGIGPQPYRQTVLVKQYENLIKKYGTPRSMRLARSNRTAYDYVEALSAMRAHHKSLAEAFLRDVDYDQYILEYAVENGFLRLSTEMRKRLNIPVKVVHFDPDTSKCFGNEFSRFLLRDLLGYDDLLVVSLNSIAGQAENKGYIRNIITGENYLIAQLPSTPWISLPIAGLGMLLFTISVSTILRFSHHQIFMFIVEFLHMLEFNVRTVFPIAPLPIVILSLIGMEAVMSEFFDCATTTLYIILTVWLADQFDAICSHTPITKRNWLKFFYLYHFGYYAYHCRFAGLYRSLALTTSWLFIQHSMIFFFHHYELPAILARQDFLIQPNVPDPMDGMWRRTMVSFNQAMRWQVDALGHRLGFLRQLRQQREAQRVQRFHAPRLRAIGTVRISGGRIQNAEDLIRRLDEETRRWHQEQFVGEQMPPAQPQPQPEQQVPSVSQQQPTSTAQLPAQQQEQQSSTTPAAAAAQSLPQMDNSATRFLAMVMRNVQLRRDRDHQRRAHSADHQSTSNAAQHTSYTSMVNTTSTTDNEPQDRTAASLPESAMPAIRFGVAIGNESTFVEVPLLQLVQEYATRSRLQTSASGEDLSLENMLNELRTDVEGAASRMSTDGVDSQNDNSGAALPATLTTNTSTIASSTMLDSAQNILQLSQQGLVMSKVAESVATQAPQVAADEDDNVEHNSPSRTITPKETSAGTEPSRDTELAAIIAQMDANDAESEAEPNSSVANDAAVAAAAAAAAETVTALNTSKPESEPAADNSAVK